MNPEDLRFTKTHEWVAIDGETATVGISDFAVKELTDLVYIELPSVGANVTAGESFGEVESVKAVSDLYSPVDGQVIAVNEQLPDDLDVLGTDPYGAGWMVRVEISDEAGLAKLMDLAAYQRQCAEEGDH